MDINQKSRMGLHSSCSESSFMSADSHDMQTHVYTTICVWVCTHLRDHSCAESHIDTHVTFHVQNHMHTHNHLCAKSHKTHVHMTISVWAHRYKHAQTAIHVQIHIGIAAHIIGCIRLKHMRTQSCIYMVMCAGSHRHTLFLCLQYHAYIGSYTQSYV